MSGDTTVAVTVTVNRTRHRLTVGPAETLLHTLRERLWLTGTKEGCVEGECGACTVLVDDVPADSCLLVTATVDGRRIRTVEGLSDGDRMSPLQQAFVEHAAVQCGFCTPGFLMTLTALLEQRASPSPEEIRTALAGNICRCTGYRQIIEAATAAATRPAT